MRRAKTLSDYDSCFFRPAENLMLTSKDTNNAVVQLVDFGCAVSYRKDDAGELESLEASKKRSKNSPLAPRRMLASTPAYCPPEVLRMDQPCTEALPSFDMWSLGSTQF